MKHYPKITFTVIVVILDYILKETFFFFRYFSTRPDHSLCFKHFHGTAFLPHAREINLLRIPPWCIDITGRHTYTHAHVRIEFYHDILT